MNGWDETLWISIIMTALMLSLLVLWFISTIPGIDHWNKRFFQSYYIVFIPCCLSGLTTIALYHHNAQDAIIYSVMILECLLLSLPPLMLTVFLLHYCGENMRSSKLLHVVVVLWIVYIVILARGMFIRDLFYIRMDYYRGPLYQLLLLPIDAIQLINLAGMIHRRKLFDRKAFTSFLIALVPVTVAMIVQLFIDATLFIDICYVISGLSMYRFVLADQIELDLSRQREIARQQQEIARQRTSILVLQMRPHFIYNTLTTIYCLCRQDSEKAQQITENFTNYLRQNFNAVVNDKAIPFSSELEHTRAYLAVEQAMYEDMLVVDWDTPFTNFRLPSLTLQPIVENAVKHGRNPNASPLHISVRTRKTDSGSEIVVTDNGPGFDLSDSSDPGIALVNIRQRLEMMCNGSLTITSGGAGGTVVTVTIPDSIRKET